MIQRLNGVKIIPRGKNNRFISQNWPNSYAFGGWIYSANVSIGYNYVINIKSFRRNFNL